MRVETDLDFANTAKAGVQSAAKKLITQPIQTVRELETQVRALANKLTERHRASLADSVCAQKLSLELRELKTQTATALVEYNNRYAELERERVCLRYGLEASRNGRGRGSEMSTRHDELREAMTVLKDFWDLL
jgi:hypothetical protein